MSDLISRQDAIDALSNLVSSMSVCVSKEECRGMKEMQNRAITAIKELPKKTEVRIEREKMEECTNCGFLNEFGYCECSPFDKWYACPIESNKPENIQALKEYAERGEEDG